MTEETPSPSPSDRQRSEAWRQRLVVRVAVLLFLAVACLTLPKIGRRFRDIARRHEARQAVMQNEVGEQAPGVRSRVHPGDVVLIVAVAVGGGLTLLGVGFLALRPGKNPEKQTRQIRRKKRRV